MRVWQGIGAGVLAFAVVGCGSGGGDGTASSGGGTIAIDGSSTVYPVAANASDLFEQEFGQVDTTISQAGTGAGFEKFANGEIDFATASRPVKPDEVENLRSAGVEFVELPVAFDGICIVVNSENDWLESITMEQLNEIWKADSEITNWNQIDPSFPDLEIQLFGPTSDHGTFEYFNEAVNGESDDFNPNYNSNKDYNVLVQGVANDRGALGYVGYAYYEENSDMIRAVGVDSGAGPILPSEETIMSNVYTPLSRPLFMYVRADRLDDENVRNFAEFMMSRGGQTAVEMTGYIRLPDSAYEVALEHIDSRATGTRFQNAAPGMGLEDVLRQAAG